MKWFKYCCATMLLISLMFINASAVNAMESGFTTDSVPEDKEKTFQTNTNISIIKEEPARKTIKCFDVNKDELIAIGQTSSGDSKTICIYSKNGEYLYGYSFNCTGSYAVEWADNNLNIYYVRSGKIVTVDPTGAVLDIADVQDTIDNNSYYHNQLCSTERICGETVYKIRNDMGVFNWLATSYSQLVAKSHTGEEMILYNVSSEQIATISAICVIAIIFIPSVTFIVLYHYIQQKRPQE